MESKKAPEQIRIKTLEEIRQEKAAKSQHQSQKDVPTVVAPETNNKTQITKGAKRAITIKEVSIDHVKTFSEILHAKKKRQEEQEQKPSAKKAKHTVEKAPGKGESDTAGPDPAAANIGEVKVKTLEEIRREKAAKIQAQQALEAENKKSSDNEENSVKKPRLLRIKKPASQSKTAPTFFQGCSLCVDTRNVYRIVVNPAVVNVIQIELIFGSSSYMPCLKLLNCRQRHRRR